MMIILLTAGIARTFLVTTSGAIGMGMFAIVCFLVRNAVILLADTSMRIHARQPSINS